MKHVCYKKNIIETSNISFIYPRIYGARARPELLVRLNTVNSGKKFQILSFYFVTSLFCFTTKIRQNIKFGLISTNEHLKGSGTYYLHNRSHFCFNSLFDNKQIITLKNIRIELK